MKTKYKIGAAIIGSFVLGVGASNILHAQAKPPAFVWAEIDIKDNRARNVTLNRVAADRRPFDRRRALKAHRGSPHRHGPLDRVAWTG
jgi:hypothetical protein